MESFGLDFEWLVALFLLGLSSEVSSSCTSLNSVFCYLKPVRVVFCCWSCHIWGMPAGKKLITLNLCSYYSWINIPVFCLLLVTFPVHSNSHIFVYCVHFVIICKKICMINNCTLLHIFVFMSPFRGKAKQKQVCLTLCITFIIFTKTWIYLSDSQLF